jgi:hypothetical protein
METMKEKLAVNRPSANSSFRKSGKRRSSRSRSQRGAALFLSVGFTFLVFLITAPIIIFFANSSTQLTVQSQASQVAWETAQIVDEYRYWLEAPRPGFEPAKAEATAASAAEYMGNAIGLKNTKVRITYEKDKRGNDLTVCHLSADATDRFPARVNIFGFDMAKIFSAQVSVSAHTSHSQIKPYALIHMDAPRREDQSVTRPLGFNERDVAVIPAFGFFYKAVGGVGGSATAYGKGMAKNLTPENFRAMNHYHLKKTDIETALSGKEVRGNSWNPQRMNDNEVTYVR